MTSILITSQNDNIIESYTTALQEFDTYNVISAVWRTAELREAIFREQPAALLVDFTGCDSVETERLLSVLNMPLYRMPVVFALLSEPELEMPVILPGQIADCFSLSASADEVAARIDAYLSTLEQSGDITANFKRLYRLTTEIMLDLGTQSSHKGFYMLRYAILLLVSRSRRNQYEVRGSIYELVTHYFPAALSDSDFVMSKAVNAAWLRADVEQLERYFGFTADPMRGAPIGISYACTVAEHVRNNFRFVD